MIRRQWTVWGGLAIAVWMCACGVNLTPLRRAVEQKRWSDAARQVREDSSLAQYYASLLIEAEAVRSARPKPWVLLLRPETKAGKSALERLAAGDIGQPVTKMALIVLARQAGGLADLKPRSWQRESGDVRALWATSFAHELPNGTLDSLLVDVNDIVRGAAVAALCGRKMEPTRFAQMAKRLKNDPLPHVRAAAARCGGALGENAFFLLTETVREEKNDGVVKGALEGLLRLGTSAAIQFIHNAANGPMNERKVFAASLLAARNFATAQQRLIDALANADEGVRLAAVEALARVHMNGEGALLKTALNDSPPVALAAARVMLQKHVKPDAAVAYLRKRVSTGSGDTEAIILLARKGDADGVKKLMNAMKDDAFFTTYATRLFGLAALRGMVVERLGSDSREVRLAAAQWVISSLTE